MVFTGANFVQKLRVDSFACLTVIKLIFGTVLGQNKLNPFSCYVKLTFIVLREILGLRRHHPDYSDLAYLLLFILTQIYFS